MSGVILKVLFLQRLVADKVTKYFLNAGPFAVHQNANAVDLGADPGVDNNVKDEQGNGGNDLYRRRVCQCHSGKHHHWRQQGDH